MSDYVETLPSSKGIEATTRDKSMRKWNKAYSVCNIYVRLDDSYELGEILDS